MVTRCPAMLCWSAGGSSDWLTISLRMHISIPCWPGTESLQSLFDQLLQLGSALQRLLGDWDWWNPCRSESLPWPLQSVHHGPVLDATLLLLGATSELRLVGAAHAWNPEWWMVAAELYDVLWHLHGPLHWAGPPAALQRLQASAPCVLQEMRGPGDLEVGAQWQFPFHRQQIWFRADNDNNNHAQRVWCHTSGAEALIHLAQGPGGGHHKQTDFLNYMGTIDRTRILILCPPHHATWLQIWSCSKTLLSFFPLLFLQNPIQTSPSFPLPSIFYRYSLLKL